MAALVDFVLQFGVEALGLVLGVDAAADAATHAEFVTARFGRHQPFVSSFADAHFRA